MEKQQEANEGGAQKPEWYRFVHSGMADESWELFKEVSYDEIIQLTDDIRVRLVLRLLKCGSGKTARKKK